MDLFEIADFIGIVAFAIAGIMACQGKNVDPVGVFILAFLTAFGGGLFRDLVIDNRPFYWIAHVEYIWLTIGLTAIAPSLVRNFRHEILYAVLIWADAIGLACFSISGTALSVKAGIPYLPATILGVCTGVLGGIVRDVFMIRLPMVLSDKRPYAAAAFIGAWIYLGLVEMHINNDAAFILSNIFIVGLRMVCWYKKLNLVSYYKHRDGTL